VTATGIYKGVCHFHVACGSFKWPGSARMWPCSTLKNLFGLSSDVLVQFEWLASWSECECCGAAEVPKEQARKWTDPRVPWPRYSRKL